MEPSQNQLVQSRLSNVFAGIILLVSLAFLMPSLFYPKVHFGQLGKQTFAAQMIESTAKGELDHGFFPTRHFVEVYHNDVVPWAEEVPLYSFMSSALVKLFGASPIQAGKTWSFLAFLLIVIGFIRIARTLQQPAWIFAVTALTYPVFRLYSVQVMPDLCMTAALVWMIESALRGKTGRAALFLMVASLFKYYAVFTGFGLGLYFLYRRQWKDCVWFALAVIPCVLYVAWFLKLGVPNPIVDSRVADGHGHFSSAATVFSIKDWVRVVLWWFVKNASIPGTLLALTGAYFAFQKKQTRPLLICMAIGFVLFPVLFISSFYVHDYYGLQGSIGIALLAAFGLSKIARKNLMGGVAALLIFLGFSIVTVRFMAKLMPDYQVIETAIETLHIPKTDFVLSVSGISKPVITFHLGQNAYIVGVDEWGRENVQQRIADPRLHYAFIHDFKNDDAMLKPVENDLIRLGFKRMDLNPVLSETVFEAWSK